MRCEPHPVSGFIYREVGEGLVRVEDGEKGRYGLFNANGTWIEGELTHADPCMLDYIGAVSQLPEGWDVYWPVLPLELDAGDPPAARPGLQYEAARAAAQSPRIVGGYVPDPGMETPEGMRSAAYVDQDFLLANDRRPELVPASFHLKAPAPGGPRRVGVDRYLKREIHDLEVERLWKKTWQMVCREDDIPELGDHYVYDVANLSFLIVRTGERDYKAHYNACLHRGRQLRECSGRKAHEFRCPFHGWTWGIDGALKHITTEWDFPGVREEVGRLPGAKVATWGGFIFINPDPDAEPLEAFMGPEMIDHYAAGSSSMSRRSCEPTGSWRWRRSPSPIMSSPRIRSCCSKGATSPTRIMTCSAIGCGSAMSRAASRARCAGSIPAGSKCWRAIAAMPTS